MRHAKKTKGFLAVAAYCVLTPQLCNAFILEGDSKNLDMSWEIAPNLGNCIISPLSVDLGYVKTEEWIIVDTPLDVECTGSPMSFNLAPKMIDTAYMEYGIVEGARLVTRGYADSSGKRVYVGFVAESADPSVAGTSGYANIILNSNGDVTSAGNYFSETDFTGKKTYNLKAYVYIPPEGNDFSAEQVYDISIPVAMKSKI